MSSGSVWRINTLLGEPNQNRADQVPLAKFIIDALILQYKIDINVLDGTYLRLFDPNESQVSKGAIAKGKFYRSPTLRECLMYYLLEYLKVVDHIITSEQKARFPDSWEKLFETIGYIPYNDGTATVHFTNAAGNPEIIYPIKRIEYTLHAYFYQLKHPKDYLNSREEEKGLDTKAAIQKYETYSDDALDTEWLIFYKDIEHQVQPTYTKLAALRQIYQNRKRTPLPQLFTKTTPALVADPNTEACSVFLRTNVRDFLFGKIDYAWVNYRTLPSPEFKLLVAYQNLVEDELEHWFIDTTSEREFETIESFWKFLGASDRTTAKKRDGKYVFQTKSGEPDITYEHFNDATQTWEEKGILSHDQFKQEVIRHLSPSKEKLAPFHEKHLDALIGKHFYHDMESLGLKNFVREKPGSFIKGTPSINRTLNRIPNHTYPLTIGKRSVTTAVSRIRNQSAPRPGEFRVRMNNRNYAVTIKGGRKKNKSRRNKSHKNKSRRNKSHSAFRVKNSK